MRTAHSGNHGIITNTVKGIFNIGSGIAGAINKHKKQKELEKKKREIKSKIQQREAKRASYEKKVQDAIAAKKKAEVDRKKAIAAAKAQTKAIAQTKASIAKSVTKGGVVRVVPK